MYQEERERLHKSVDEKSLSGLCKEGTKGRTKYAHLWDDHRRTH